MFLSLTLQAVEGSLVDLGNPVVVELEGGEAGQPIEVARSQRGQLVVVQSKEIKRFEAWR